MPGNEHAGDGGIELTIQLAPQQSAAPQAAVAPAQQARVAKTAPAPTIAARKPSKRKAQKNQSKQSANAQSRAGGPQGTADYYAKLQAWLNAHKHYPTEARHQGWEGVTELEFVVQTNGTVAWSRLARSSGYLMLDDAATRLLADAQPLPPPPSELDAAARHVRVPISFRLY